MSKTPTTPTTPNKAKAPNKSGPCMLPVAQCEDCGDALYPDELCTHTYCKLGRRKKALSEKVVKEVMESLSKLHKVKKSDIEIAVKKSAFSTFNKVVEGINELIGGPKGGYYPHLPRDV